MKGFENLVRIAATFRTIATGIFAPGDGSADAAAGSAVNQACADCINLLAVNCGSADCFKLSAPMVEFGNKKSTGRRRKIRTPQPNTVKNAESRTTVQ